MRACSWLSGEVANAQESSIVIGIPPGCPHDLCACDMVLQRPNARCQPRLEAGAQRTLEGVGCTPSLGPARKRVLFLHPELHDGCSRGQATFWSHCPCEGREKGLHTGVKKGCTLGKAERLLAHQGALSQSCLLEAESENGISENQWLEGLNFPVFGDVRQSQTHCVIPAGCT